MKIIAITQARIGSTRLPKKVLRQIGDKSLLQIHFERLLKSTWIDEFIVATTNEPGVEEIVEIGHRLGIVVFQGAISDVLDRFYQAAKDRGADYVVRLTADCPLIDASLVDEVISYAISHSVDYASNTLSPGFPDGEDVEVFSISALEKAWRSASLPSEREHVTPFIWKNSNFFNQPLFTALNYSGDKNYSAVRLTVDEESDFQTITQLIEELGEEAGWEQYAAYYTAHAGDMPNFRIQRNEGYQKSIADE
jgi:spore coat polysaccharide biosynthesis protein SpsF